MKVRNGHNARSKCVSSAFSTHDSKEGPSFIQGPPGYLDTIVIREAADELTAFLFTVSPSFLLGQPLPAYLFPGHSVRTSINSFTM